MPPSQTYQQQQQDFSEDEIQGLYKTIFNRRDVRGQFKPDPVPDDVLSRILYASHHAPSVGFMQPWNFIVIRSPEVKANVHQLFSDANREAAELFEGEQQQTYRSLKLEGIVESPINICITCDRDRAGPHVIGRTHIKTMDLYSSVCAVQNLWLAARAEGIGIGWVSILNQHTLQKTLNIPKKVVPIAYLCLGYVDYFFEKPELEIANWRNRLPLEELIYFDQWENTQPRDSLIDQIAEHGDFPNQF